MSGNERNMQPAQAGRFYAYLICWLVALCLLGYFVPIHTDELSFHFNDRAYYDGFAKTALTPQCRSIENLSLTIPASLYPHAYLTQKLYAPVSDLFALRALGGLRFLLLFIPLYYIAAALKPFLNASAGLLLVVLGSMFLLDATPIMLQMERAECPILLAVLIVIASALNAEKLQRCSAPKWVAILALNMLAVYFLICCHPKIVTLLPIVMLCIYRVIAARAPRSLAIAALLGIGWLAYDVTHYWVSTIECQMQGSTKAFLAAHSFPIATALHNPPEFFKQLALIVASVIISDFAPTYFEAWLPFNAGDAMGASESVIMVVLMTITLLRFGLFIFALSLFFKQSFMLVFKKAGTEFLPWLAVISFLSFVGLTIISGQVRMFYFPAAELPLLAISTMLMLAVEDKRTARQRNWSRIARWLCLLVTVSVLQLFARYYPLIIQTQSGDIVLHEEGYDRPILYAANNYDTMQEKLLNAYAQCGLPAQEKAKHLTLDTDAYWALRKTYQPYLFEYFSETYLLHHKISPEEFTRRLNYYQSDGVLAKCERIPADYRSLFTEYGNYCCIKK